MNAIGRKLQSRRGASITFALLIFLVCAVVSSVVVVAGTAAAGRMSNLAESDQRYYAVTSAAGLLRDKICTEDKVRVEYNKSTHGDITVMDNNGNPLQEDTTKLLAKALLDKSDQARRFELAPTTAIPNANLNCTVAETVGQSGLAEFKVSSGDGTNAYTLRVRFSSNVKRTTSATDATREVMTVEWKLHSIDKVR